VRTFDYAIIGGGIVGLAAALKLAQKRPDAAIALFEKEPELATHQTGHNSGVIHSGLYYKPGSERATHCARGRRELVEFAKTHGITHDICGKIVVATQKEELPFLENSFQNGLANNIEGIEKIGPEKISEIEPHCEGLEAIWVPCTGIINFRAVAEKFGELFKEISEKNEIIKGAEVTDFIKSEDKTELITNKGKYQTRVMICCGGLESDRIARKDEVEPGVKILGFRGDYYDLSERGRRKVRNLIYPVANPAFPVLGVHFTRMIDGSVECGPNAVFTFKREGYGKIDFSLKDTVESLSYGGTWKLFKREWKFGLDEYARAFSKRLFLSRLRKLIPSLESQDLVPGRSGVRALAVSSNGEMVDDFKIKTQGRSLHVLNAPSPAATASLAIAETITKKTLHL